MKQKMPSSLELDLSYLMILHNSTQYWAKTVENKFKIHLKPTFYNRKKSTTEALSQRILILNELSLKFINKIQ